MRAIPLGKRITFARALALLAILVIAILAPIAVFAQSSGNYSLEWFTVDNGGGNSQGGTYILDGTAGQFDAYATPASGGSYTVSGGFWQPGAVNTRIYLPLVRR